MILDFGCDGTYSEHSGATALIETNDEYEFWHIEIEMRIGGSIGTR